MSGHKKKGKSKPRIPVHTKEELEMEKEKKAARRKNLSGKVKR